MSHRNPHLLLLAIPAWGHVRPLCVLASKLVQSRDIVVTYLTTANLVEQCEHEIARQFTKEQNHLANRVRVISITEPVEGNVFQVLELFIGSYSAAFETLYNGKAPTCKSTRKTHDPLPRPSAIIMDFFALPQLEFTRKLAGTSLPVIAWMSGGASSLIRLFGPEEIGGIGDFSAKIDSEALRTGRNADEIGDEIFRRTDGSVVNISGLPVMYDYEFFPQELPFNVPMTPIIKGAFKFLMECDAVILATAEAYELKPLKVIKDWFAKLSKPVYAVGPLLFSNYGATLPKTEKQEENQHDEKAESKQKVEDFLDRAQKKYGDRKVVYISFGTIFWTTKPEYIEEMIDALLEMDIPFIFTHASPFAQIPESVLERVKASGIGLMTTWSPQQLILQHPATGWFLTHCGHGSVFESLCAGIPLICWPFDADQPAGAAHLTDQLDVAFELIEVRTGLGLKPIHRFPGRQIKGTREAVATEFRDVFRSMASPIGVRKTENVQVLARSMLGSWDEGGASRRDLEEFMQIFLD